MMESTGAVANAPSGAQLIVRVKRRREDDPAETICLYDDNHSQQLEPTSKRNKKSLVNEMSRIMNMNDDVPNQDAVPPPRKRLMLQRISTLEQFSYATIDQDTAMAITKKRSREASGGGASDNHSNSIADNATITNDININKKRRIKLLVAQSKKTTSLATALTDQKTSCVIVDTMQLFDATVSSSNLVSNANDQTIANEAPSKKKILNPPTRLLGQAIVTAVTRNDFNDLSRALIQGADINHQLDNTHPTAGGFTALMAAAHRGNMRILKRLLLDSSLTCVRAHDAQGRTALDLLPIPTPRTAHEIQEMRQLLEQSVIRQHQQEALNTLENQRQQQKTQKVFAQHGESVFSRFANSSNTHDAAGALGEEYVVDIYVIQAPNNDDRNYHGSEDVQEEEEKLVNEMDMDASSNNMFSILRVEGLRIDDETGQVELVAYDSDWSDLADDEEPDSNDERHYANDYPDESDEDNGGRMFAEVDDDEEEDSDNDDDDDDVGMGSKLHRRQQKRHQPKRSRNYQANSMGKTPAVIIQPPQFGGTNNNAHKSVSFATNMDVEDLEEPTGDNGVYSMDNDDADEEEDEDEEDDIEIDLAEEINQFFGSSGNGRGPDVTTLLDGHCNHGTRIMKPFQLSGERMDEDKKAGHTSESLQEFWGMDGQAAADVSDHEERVEHLRERTGMVFTANSHGLDRETGLPT